MSLQRKPVTDSLQNSYKQSFSFPKAKVSSVTFPFESGKGNLRCPSLVQIIEVYDSLLSRNLIYVEQVSASLAFLFWKWAFSLLCCTLKRCIGASHTSTGTSCFLAPVTTESGKGDSPSFMVHSTIPILWTQSYTHTHSPARASHGLPLTSIEGQHDKEMLQQDFIPSFLSLLSLPPLSLFSPSLGIKWSNDVLLQNSISQFS